MKIPKYLQTFSLISINLKSSNELHDILESIENGEFSKEDLKDKKISEDECKENQKQIQKVTDEEIGKVESTLETKEKEIMSV